MNLQGIRHFHCVRNYLFFPEGFRIEVQLFQFYFPHKPVEPDLRFEEQIYQLRAWRDQWLRQVCLKKRLQHAQSSYGWRSGHPKRIRDEILSVQEVKSKISSKRGSDGECDRIQSISFGRFYHEKHQFHVKTSANSNTLQVAMQFLTARCQFVFWSELSSRVLK